MSKIICDICGTTYPETADQCPICGCARDVGGQVVAEDAFVPSDNRGTRTAAPVKGGRFSASNVRKRNQNESGYQPGYFSDEPDEPEKPKSNTGLIILLVLVIAALIAVTGYIFVKFYLPNMPGHETETTAQTEIQTEGTTEATTEPSIPCESLALTSGATVAFSEEGQNWLLNVIVLPANTTDILSYASSDETVATVNEQGKVTSVGEGEATITITCGEKQLECRILVDFPNSEETTAPEQTEETVTTEETEETTVETTEAPLNITLKLNKTDLTFAYKGETFQLKVNSELSAEDVIWRSEDPSIATVENGLLTAVGSGTTIVYAQYGDQIVECIVRCAI